MQNKKKVIFILGPTGVGKTALSVDLAKQFNGEVISADSVQVFKGFDIGSAKVTREEMQGVIHHGIDIVSPDQEFSASEFVNFTKEKIEEISARGKLPIIAGGTALYVKSLVEGYNFGGTEKHEDFREMLEKEIDENGIDFVYSKFKNEAGDVASEIDGKNKKRLIRAYEIFKFGTGKEKDKNNVEYDFRIFALTMPREKLYERNGLVDEVCSLYQKYGNCQPMCAIGYKEVLPYLRGELSLEEMDSLISQHTRNYAKRQLTFLRGMTDVCFVDVSKEEYKNKMKEEIEKWLN